MPRQASCPGVHTKQILFFFVHAFLFCFVSYWFLLFFTVRKNMKLGEKRVDDLEEFQGGKNFDETIFYEKFHIVIKNQKSKINEGRRKSG